MYIARTLVASTKATSRELARKQTADLALEKLKQTQSYIRVLRRETPEEVKTWEEFKAEAEKWVAVHKPELLTTTEEERRPELTSGFSGNQSKSATQKSFSGVKVTAAGQMSNKSTDVSTVKGQTATGGQGLTQKSSSAVGNVSAPQAGQNVGQNAANWAATGQNAANWAATGQNAANWAATGQNAANWAATGQNAANWEATGQNVANWAATGQNAANWAATGQNAANWAATGQNAANWAATSYATGQGYPTNAMGSYGYSYPGYDQCSYVYDQYGYCHVVDSSGQYIPYMQDSQPPYPGLTGGQFGQGGTPGQYPGQTSSLAVSALQSYKTKTGQLGGTAGGSTGQQASFQLQGSQIPKPGRWDQQTKTSTNKASAVWTTPQQKQQQKQQQQHGFGKGGNSSQQQNNKKGSGKVERKAFRLLSEDVSKPPEGKFQHLEEPLLPCNKKVVAFMEHLLEEQCKLDCLDEVSFCINMPLAERQVLENVALKYDFKLIMRATDRKVSVVRWIDAQDTLACLKRHNNKCGRFVLEAEDGIPTGVSCD